MIEIGIRVNNVRYVLAVCEENSFTLAAKRCGVAQPSLTVAISRLEEKFGGALFFRSQSGKRKIAPTKLLLSIKPHLEKFIEYAEKVEIAATRHNRLASRRGREHFRFASTALNE
jgi:DNA-binding transcriptional LysR family regulator